MIRQRVQPLAQLDAQLIRHLVLIERPVHAPEPLVALARADGEGQVSRAQTRMAALLDIRRRPAGPTHEIQIQFFAGCFETRRVERANRLRLGRAVDEIVEPVDEAANAGVAAEELERSRGSGGHTERYGGDRD